MAFIIPLARFCAQAAAVLPIIALLSLLAGRRGNGAFCLADAAWLCRLGFALGIAGPIWLVFSCLYAVLPYHLDLAALCGLLIMPAGLSWSLSLLSWLVGLCLFWSGYIAVMAFAARLGADSYPTRQLALPIGLFLAAAFFLFAPFALINWPFAGFPQGLDKERVIMAIFRHANSEYFRGFCAAGAIALALWPIWPRRFAAAETAIAARWLAFWAFAGNLPWLLSSLGPALGAWLNASQLAAAYGVGLQLGVLALFTGAAFCWAFLLWRPRHLRICAWAGFALACAAILLGALGSRL